MINLFIVIIAIISVGFFAVTLLEEGVLLLLFLLLRRWQEEERSEEERDTKIERRRRGKSSSVTECFGEAERQQTQSVVVAGGRLFEECFLLPLSKSEVMKRRRKRAMSFAV